MNKEKNILLSWFYMYHGISFFKHVLSAFSTGVINLNDKEFERMNISQTKMQTVFEKKEFEYVFDKVYIFYPDNPVYKKHTGKSYGFRKKALTETDDEVKKTGTVKLWEDIIKKGYNIQEEFEYIKNTYPNKKELLYSQYWRNIQHYTPDEQIWWLMNKSNLPEKYKERIEFINMNKKYEFTNLWDYKKIAEVTYNEVFEIYSKYKNANFFINVSLSTKEIQVAWFSLAQGNFLPINTKLFESYDVKSTDKNKRFKDFFIKQVPSNILDIIKKEISLFKIKPTGKKREIINLLFKSYINQGFAITLIGERGIGKTNIIQSFTNEKETVIVDCVKYENDDILAEKEIFGYKSWAVRGASKSDDGLFIKSGGGILVFDEISKLSVNMQSRLMQALRTDTDNYFKIRHVGGKRYERIKCDVIFTSSINVLSLKKKLLPELYDRIMQLVIELPPLRETKEEIPIAFENIWNDILFEKKGYKFRDKVSSEMINWLKYLPLYGNYRDLQRIAIIYKAYLDFPDILKEYLKEKDAFEYVKSQYKKYISVIENNVSSKYFYTDKSTNEIIKNFKSDLANWLIVTHGSQKKAVNFLKKEYKEKITQTTISNWKNKK